MTKDLKLGNEASNMCDKYVGASNLIEETLVGQGDQTLGGESPVDQRLNIRH